jgi:hypothetical protein
MGYFARLPIATCDRDAMTPSGLVASSVERGRAFALLKALRSELGLALVF